MAASKPLCPTCGYKIPRSAKQTKISEEIQVEVSTPSFWSKVARWDFASPSTKKTESA